MNKDRFYTEEKQHMIDDLGSLVGIPSISEDVELTKVALAKTLEVAANLGLRTEAVLDGRVGVVEIGEGDETIGILTHVDVVPPGDLENWDSDPFEMVMKDDVLYGRGVMDDKGPVIACLYAMKYLAECGKPLHKKVQMVIGTQEEVEWTEMAEYVKFYELPDYGFTPDGEFPICNVEKGDGYFNYRFPLHREKEQNHYIKSITAGIVENAIPDKCTVVVVKDGVEETIAFDGKAAHSSTPEQGENAIIKACEALESKGYDHNGVLEAIRTICQCFVDVDCGQIDMKTEDQYLNGEFIHKNIVMPTLLETTDEEVLLRVNLRSAFGTSDEKVMECFAKVTEGRDCVFEVKEYQSPIYISRESKFLQTLSAAYEKHSGFEAGFTIEYGGTYAKAIPNVVNWGPVFPGQFYSGHEANEYMSVKDLLLNSIIFAEALELMATSEESFKCMK